MKSSVILSRAGTFPRFITNVDILVFALVFVPFLVHVLPVWGDVPPGARLLPIFFAPLVAALHSRIVLAITLAVLTPWVSYFLTGRPHSGIAVLLSVELLLFTAWIFALVRGTGLRWWIGPAAYLLTKPISGALLLVVPGLVANFSYVEHLTSAVTRSWLGLIALAILGLIASQLKGRERDGQPEDGKAG